MECAGFLIIMFSIFHDTDVLFKRCRTVVTTVEVTFPATTAQTTEKVGTFLHFVLPITVNNIHLYILNRKSHGH